jgi:hypothetical protein
VRTFSALRERCNYPELIDLVNPMSKHRQRACDVGTELHRAVENWVRYGTPLERDGADPITSKDARSWFERMASTWAPPKDCKTELALGITDDGRAVEVDEIMPHEYTSRSASDALITAGRLDLLWVENYGTAVVVDIKTGRSYLGDPWRIPQLVAQAYAVSQWMREHDDYEQVYEVKLGVYYARLGLFDFGDSAESVSDVRDMFPTVRRWALADNDPKPGAHCLSCYSASNCSFNPAKKEAAL